MAVREREWRECFLTRNLKIEIEKKEKDFSKKRGLFNIN
jgi:hypothetical protein